MQLSRPRPRPADGGSWVRRVLRRRCGRALGRIRIRRRPARASSRGRWRADPSGVTSPRLRRGTPVATPLSERRGVAMNSCAYVCSRCASGEWRCHPTTPPSSQMRRRGVRRQRRRRLRLTRVGARGLNVRDTTRIRRILCIPMYPGRNPGTPPGYGQNTQDTLRIQYPTKYTQDILGYIRIRAEYNLIEPRPKSHTVENPPNPGYR